MNSSAELIHFPESRGVETEPFLELCESPIEVWMARALAFAPWIGAPRAPANRFSGLLDAVIVTDDASDRSGFRTPLDLSRRLRDLRYHVAITPQAWVGRYRVDFFILATLGCGLAPRCAIVECDGAEYHSSPAQRRRDYERDQRILKLGRTQIFRFTGSQINQDAGLCARQVVGRMFGSHLLKRDVEGAA